MPGTGQPTIRPAQVRNERHLPPGAAQNDTPRRRTLPFDCSFGPASAFISNKSDTARNDTPRIRVLPFDRILDFRMQRICQPLQLTHTIHTRSKPQRAVDNLPNVTVLRMRTHQNLSERRCEDSTIVNRQPGLQNAVRSLQNGRGAPEAEHSS